MQHGGSLFSMHAAYKLVACLQIEALGHMVLIEPDIYQQQQFQTLFHTRGDQCAIAYYNYIVELSM